MRYINDFLAFEKEAKRKYELERLKLTYYRLLGEFEVFDDKAYKAARFLDFSFVLESKEFTASEKRKVATLERKSKKLLDLPSR